MLNEVLSTIAQIALYLFVITSMLAMGMSLTVKQIVDPIALQWVAGIAGSSG